MNGHKEKKLAFYATGIQRKGFSLEIIKNQINISRAFLKEKLRFTLLQWPSDYTFSLSYPTS